MPQQKSNLQSWFEWCIAWVKDFVFKRKNKAERKLLTLELLQSRDGFVFAESVTRCTPGAVATWYIVHKKHPNTQIIITLDNLFELKKFLKEPLPDNTVYIYRTHIVSVQWIVKVGDRKKQVYKFKGAWLADLQGRTGAINAKAFDVVRYMVMEVINLPSMATHTWEARLNQYNWEDAIVSKSRLVGDNHKPHLKKVGRLELLQP